MDNLLTAMVKKKAFELGADLVGVGNIERWEKAPLLMSPLGLMPDGKAVLVCAIHHTDAMIEVGGEGSPHEQGTYSYQYHMNNQLDVISYTMGRFLEDLGYRAIPITASNIWRYREYNGLKATFAPDMSHIYASVAAGLSELGYSGLAMTPEFGPRNRFVSIVTDAPLAPDPLLPGGTLCDKCGQCIQHCCTEALGKEVEGEVAIEIEGHKYMRANKNLWRCAWSEHFGLNAEAEIPEKVTEQVILDKLRELGMRGGTMGCCIKFCLPRDKRSYNKEYSSAPIRKKAVTPVRATPDRGVMQKLASNALVDGADRVVTLDLAGWKGAPLGSLLPDAKSMVLVSVSHPVSYSSATTDSRTSVLNMMGYTMNKCCFDIASALEKLGYSGAPYFMGGLREDPGKAALASVKEKAQEMFGDTVAGFVLTSAVLPALDLKADFQPRAAGLDATAEVERLAYSFGCDAVGFTSAARLAKAAASVKSAMDGDKILNAKETGALWLSSTADIEVVKRSIHTPQDHLADAKSVIVLGIRTPKQSSECMGRNGAEAIGPYSFAQYESHNMLKLAVLKMLKVLAGWGAKAVAVNDVCNTGSVTSNPRGPQPNVFANRLAAACAGLGTITKGGFVNNPKYGTNMRYLAIVTDLELKESQLCDLFALREKCQGCTRCLEHCTVKAYKGEATADIGGNPLTFAIVEQARCDWALRYGLIADEGEKWTGSKTNVVPPADITPEALADALAQRDPILRIRPCSSEMCSMACPYTRSQD